MRASRIISTVYLNPFPCWKPGTPDKPLLSRKLRAEASSPASGLPLAPLCAGCVLRSEPYFFRCHLCVLCGKCLAKPPVALVIPNQAVSLSHTLNPCHLNRLRRSFRPGARGVTRVGALDRAEQEWREYRESFLPPCWFRKFQPALSSPESRPAVRASPRLFLCALRGKNPLAVTL